MPHSIQNSFNEDYRFPIIIGNLNLPVDDLDVRQLAPDSNDSRLAIEMYISGVNKLIKSPCASGFHGQIQYVNLENFQRHQKGELLFTSKVFDSLDGSHTPMLASTSLTHLRLENTPQLAE